MFKQLTCPNCGRQFIYQFNSMYKLKVDGHMKQFCGYNCYRTVQLELESKKKQKRR